MSECCVEEKDKRNSSLKLKRLIQRTSTTVTCQAATQHRLGDRCLYKCVQPIIIKIV